MRRIVLALILLAVTAVAARAAVPTTGIQTFNLDGQRVSVRYPASTSTKAVVWVHGYGTTHDTLTSGSPAARTAMFVALQKAGYAVAASDAHRNAWGNAASLHDYERLISFLHHQGFTSIYLIAESMGGLDGLQLVDREHIIAFEGISPVCNLQSLYAGVYRTSIHTALGAATSHELTAWSPLVARHVTGLPMLFLASPADKTVPKTANTVTCAAAERHRGAKVRVVITTGYHEAPTNFRPALTVRFFNSAS